jgi:hypothetical protein
VQVFRTADATTEHCKRDMVPVPRWVAALNAPAAFLDRCSESLGKAADVRPRLCALQRVKAIQ